MSEEETVVVAAVETTISETEMKEVTAQDEELSVSSAPVEIQLTTTSLEVGAVESDEQQATMSLLSTSGSGSTIDGGGVGSDGGMGPSKLLLREWGPMYELLSRIPLKAQKGLVTLDLKLTCVAAAAEFLAIGTNVGLVYWYNRKLDLLERLKTQVGNLFFGGMKYGS
jgi:hypothetical protein